MTLRLQNILLVFILATTACKEDAQTEKQDSKIVVESPATTDSANPSKRDHEDSDALPSSVDEATEQIISEMSPEDQNLVRNTPKEDLIRFHHGWGTGIRNSLGLWGTNKELLQDTGKQHPDDASMIIIESIWARLQTSSEQDVEVKNQRKSD